MELPELLPDQPFINPDQLKGLWIPAQILHHPDLTPQEKMLASYVWHLDQDYHCYASNKWFSRQLNIRPKTINNMLSVLKKKQIIKQLSWNGKIRVLQCTVK